VLLLLLLIGAVCDGGGGGGGGGEEAATDNGESVWARIIVFGKETIVRSFIYSVRTRNKVSFESINMFYQLEAMIVVESVIITDVATDREREIERWMDGQKERTKNSIMHVYYQGIGLNETCLDLQQLLPHIACSV
jgi:hypothetical protein